MNLLFKNFYSILCVFCFGQEYKKSQTLCLLNTTVTGAKKKCPGEVKFENSENPDQSLNRLSISNKIHFDFSV